MACAGSPSCLHAGHLESIPGARGRKSRSTGFEPSTNGSSPFSRRWVLGLGTRLAAVPLVVTLVIAIRTALWTELEGAIDLFGHGEYLFIVLLASIAIAGAGAVSLDAILARTLRTGAAP